jgi:ribosomal-protein-alanine N-acetyltransferase
VTAPVLHTARLVLRGWTPGDRAPFAEMNADPEVMEHFPSALTRSASDAFVDRIEQHFADRGYGLWAVEADGALVGFTGLAVPRFHADWMDDREQPVLEVGWRLRRSAWGRGYATEAGRAALTFAFDVLGREEVVSFTVTGNARSRAVMERLGMRHLTAYDHPIEGGPSLPSVCYLLDRAEHVPWEAR